MKSFLASALVVLSSLALFGQPGPAFDDYFIDRAMRLDLYLTGDAKDEIITLDKIHQEGIWPENPNHLLEPFNNGRYAVKVYDLASNRLIYWRGFDCMFGEYRTTTPALNGVRRTLERSLRVPFPKRPVRLSVETRDKQNVLHSLFEQKIDPSDVDIIKETVDSGDYVYEGVKSGDPHKCVDLAFLAEGYTAAEKEKFKSDVDRFAGYLFTIEPYKTLKNRFNIYGVMRASPESAMDEPRQGVFRKTILNASFNAFGTDRYMLTGENRRAREIAAQVPYDAVVILVNSRRYGGGGIYDDYCITTVDNAASFKVFIHEFGHSFAGLADEYYSSDVAYNEFYPKGVEPLEPNITALLDPTHVKWQDLLSPGIRIPTEYGKDQKESLFLDRRRNAAEQTREIEQAKQKRASDAEIRAIQEKYAAKAKEIAAQIAAIDKQYAGLVDKVGVFEGAGYAAKGLYRPMMNCIMISNPKDEFCLVCQKAIARMIDYYSGQ
ncbi:MAG: IgA Peptidase M64 [Acidobacteriia bacterium]|nr:IgA Peptidase M64 [Terriglobia bacterium]